MRAESECCSHCFLRRPAVCLWQARHSCLMGRAKHTPPGVKMHAHGCLGRLLWQPPVVSGMCPLHSTMQLSALYQSVQLLRITRSHTRCHAGLLVLMKTTVAKLDTVDAAHAVLHTCEVWVNSTLHAGLRGTTRPGFLGPARDL